MLHRYQRTQHFKNTNPKGIDKSIISVSFGKFKIFWRKTMDKFLDIICANQIMSTKEQGDKYIEFFEPFMSKLKDIVSEKVYSELEEMFSSCVVENNSFYAVAGMKLAIGVIDDTYVPTV